MTTEAQNSWLGKFGVDFDKAKAWVGQEVDAAEGTLDKAENWAKDEAQKGVDAVKAEAAKAGDAIKKGADWVKQEASNAAGAVTKGADALKMKALGDQSGKPVPRPMEADCKPEHGYVPGPKNHLLCATHGHVVDTDKRAIIANSVAAYAKQGVAGAVKSADVRAAIGTPAAPPPATAAIASATASGNPSASTKPPDGVLRRKSDGQVFWSPNPAPVTIGTAAPPPAPDDWVTGFLDFYDIEPTDNPADAGQACTFNADPSTFAAVVKLLAAQAALAGYQANPNAQSIAVKLAGARQTAKVAGNVVDRITKKLAAKQDISSEIDTLNGLDMPALLEALTRLHKAGLFEALANDSAKFSNRLGAAFFTVDDNYDTEWQKLVRILGDDDKAVIRARVPDDIKPLVGGASAATPGGGPSVDTSGGVSVGPTGAEVQAKINFHSDLAGNLGDTSFTVRVGADGKLSGFKLDVTVIKQKIEKLGALAPMLDLQATLSLSSSMTLDQKTTQTIFKAVQVQAKGEIEMHFKGLKGLEKVAFKLTATAGPSGGISVTGSIVIPIPGL